MTAVFSEVRRVLKDDGVLFLNLGDSYYGSSMTGGTKSIEGSAKRMGRMFEKPSNVQHEDAYDTSGKAPADYQESGCLCQNLCGVCREVYLRTSRNYDLLVPMLIASLSLPNHENTEFGSDHFPTLDFSHLGDHIFPAILDLLHCGAHAGERLHAFQETMPDEFSRQLLDLCWRRGNSSACLLCGRSLTDNVQGFAHMSGGFSGQQMHIQNNALHDAQRGHRSQYKDKACGYCNEILTTDTPPNIQPYCTTNKWKNQLKPKDLVGIPWRVAFALQADGWYLRQDIIWHKPNPMPESVTDRCTKAHEYVFLMSKSQQYYYDNEAIKERTLTKDNSNRNRDITKLNNTPGRTKMMGLKTNDYDNRNKRSVWTVATKPFKEAHFAVFPPDLIKPMILAGCPTGGVVLDPFVGSGTTAIVARKLGRHFVGIELNEKYKQMAERRVAETTPSLFMEVTV